MGHETRAEIRDKGEHQPRRGKYCAAFLDMNGTLMRGEPGIELIEGLREQGRCPEAQYREVRDLMSRYLRRELSNEAVGELMFRVICAVVNGLTRSEVLAAYMPRYYARIRPSIFGWARALVSHLHDLGCRTYATTNIPHPLLDPLMEDIGVRRSVAPELECLDGRFTDRLLHWNWSERVKGEAVLAVAERDGLDLGKSYAFGDGEGDASYLSLVGHPVAINPSPGLQAIAEAKGWPVVRQVAVLDEVVKVL